MSENREKNNRILIITLCLVHLLLGLDINIVSVSLPIIAAKFDVTAGIATRVVWIYFLVLTCLLLGYGKLGDLKGFRNIYLTGILIFTLSSLLASFSYDFNFLVLSRILQALGAGTLFALTPAIITAFVKPEHRGKIFGLNYSFTAFGGIIGRALSGYLVEYFGWNSIFLINIPIGITALALGYYSLPVEKIISIKNKFDFIGSILIFLPLFGFLYVINTVQDFGFFSFEISGIIILSIIFFIAFLIYEKKISVKYSPIVNLKILKNRNIIIPVSTFALVYIITNGIIFIFPFLLQWIKAYDKKEIGLLMAVPSVFQMFSGYIAGSLSDKKNKIYICTTGLILTALSMVMCLFINSDSGYILILFSLILYGIAIGIFIPANTNSIMSSAPVEERGSISSIMTTVIRLGSALGVTLFGAILTNYIPQKNPVQAGVSQVGILKGFSASFIFGILVAIAGIILLLILKKNKIDSKILQS